MGEDLPLFWEGHIARAFGAGLKCQVRLAAISPLGEKVRNKNVLDCAKMPKREHSQTVT